MRSSLYKLSISLILVFSLFSVNSSAATFSEDIKFTGLVQAMPASGFIGDWRIDSKVVHVSSSTIVNQEDGQITVGATVKVEGFLRADGSLDATEVELRQAGSNSGGGSGSGSGSGSGNNSEANFKGTVQSFPANFIGDWNVSGKIIHVAGATRIELNAGAVALGTFVEVKGTTRADGSIDATKIETQSNAGGVFGDNEIKGTIEQLPATGFVGDWRVGGRTIHVTASTTINQEHGQATVGAFVEVNGTTRTDGSLDATRIEVKVAGSGGGNGGGNHDDRNELHGIVQSLPAGSLVGDWQVSGRTVHVTTATFINQEHGQVAVGSLVEVKGTTRTDGSLDATKIETKTAASVGNSNITGEGDSLNVKGTIQALPASGLVGDWIVKGRTIHVTASTKLAAEHGRFVMGTAVKVKGLTLADGSVLATKIQIRDSF